MTIGKAFYSILTADAPIAAVVAGRVMPLLCDEAAKAVPFLLYTAEAANPQSLLSGTSKLVNQLVSVTCFGRTYDEVDDLGVLVRTALNDKSGTFGGLVVQGIFVEDERETTGAFDDSPDLLFYVKEVDFKVWYVLA